MATDIEWLKALVQIMNQNELAELTLEEEGRKVRLRKTGADGRGASAGTALRTGAPVERREPKASASAGPAAAGQAERAPDVVEVVSPMVGTFYRASSPEADPYVDVGEQVKEETTLCIIEAMKVMNEIKAEVEGEVQEILVSNGEAVEFGQPLFLIKRAK